MRGDWEPQIFKYWDDEDANFFYGLRWRNEDDRIMLTEKYKKDVEWARRIASHYGIKLPEEV